jgi:hypothetical protein
MMAISERIQPVEGCVNRKVRQYSFIQKVTASSGIFPAFLAAYEYFMFLFVNDKQCFSLGKARSGFYLLQEI